MAEPEKWSRAKGHHFLTHEMPKKLSQKAVLTLIGASSISEALEWFQTKKPAELREMFEKVYKASTKSQNKRWLQRRLTEALKLKPSQYFPLGKKQLKSKSRKDDDDLDDEAFPSSSSAAARAADSDEGQPIRKSTRIPKRRQPETPTSGEVDAPFTGPSSGEHSMEEGNDDSETAVATIDSPKKDTFTHGAANGAVNAANAAAGGRDGFTSCFSSPSNSPLQKTASMPPPPPPQPASLPPLTAAAAYKLLASRGPGAHTKDSAAEVAAMVAAKRRLKSFLPSYPGASDQQVAAVLNRCFSQQMNTVVPTSSLATEYLYNGPVYPSILLDSSSNVASGDELDSILIGTTVPANGYGSDSGSGIILPEEEEDEIFMNLDPVLVHMDMSLLPDGRMW